MVYVLQYIFLVIFTYPFCSDFEHHYYWLPGQLSPKARYSQSLSPSKKALLTSKSLLLLPVRHLGYSEASKTDHFLIETKALTVHFVLGVSSVKANLTTS